MRVLVTGHTGFVGMRACAALRDRGCTVSGLETADGGAVDLLDARAVRDVFERVRPHRILHLGGVSGPMLLADRPDLVLRINGEGTLTVLAAAAAVSAQRVVFASSVAAHAGLSETDRDPLSLYGATKRLGEMLARLADRAGGIAVPIVRIGSVFGPGRQTENPIHSMVRSAICEGVVRHGSVAMEPFIHVRDCAALLAGAVMTASTEPAYDAVAYTAIDSEVADLVARETGARTEAVLCAETPPFYDRRFNAAPLLEAAGLAGFMPLESAIAELVATIRTESAVHA